MASVDVHLVVVDIVSSIGSGRRCTDRRFLVWFDIVIALDTAPGKVLNVEPPAVIESGGWVGVAAEYEELIALRGDAGNMLSTGSWEFFAFRLLLFPTDFLYKRENLKLVMFN